MAYLDTAKWTWGDLLFVPYHMAYLGFCTLLVFEAVKHDWFNPTTGLDWELYLAWACWLCGTHLLCAVAAVALRLPGPGPGGCVERIVMGFVPAISDPMDTLKDMIVTGLYFQLLGNGCYLFGGWAPQFLNDFCGGLGLPLGLASFCSVVLPPLFMYVSKDAVKAMRMSNAWGLLEPAKPACSSDLKLVLAIEEATSSAKYLITVLEDTPQAVMGFVYFLLGRGSRFVLVSFGIVIFKLFFLDEQKNKLARNYLDSLKGARAEVRKRACGR